MEETIAAPSVYEIEQCSSILEGFKIVSININGLVSREDTRKKFDLWLVARKPDVVCIQEWYIHNGDDIPDFPNDFTGYAVLSTNSKTAILYKDTLSVYLHKGTGKQQHGQSTDWISVYSKKNVINIASYYQSLAAQHHKFFDSNLNQLLKENKDVLDINKLRCKEHIGLTTCTIL